MDARAAKYLALTAENYRDFIQIWMKSSSRINYAQIARAGGFLSRSFPRDVVLGKKRITLNSLPKFIRALRLTGDWAEYFRILIEIEQPDCRSRIQDLGRLFEIKAKLKDRLETRLKNEEKGDLTLISNLKPEHPIKNSPDADNMFQVSYFPSIYAALGSKQEGASIGEVLRRTELPLEAVQSGLAYLVKNAIVQKKANRYYALEFHLNLEGISQSQVFREHFLHNADQAARLVRSGGMKSDSRLFFSTAFSVRKDQLPQLKNQLRSLLLNFVDQSEIAEGERVVNMVLSFF